MVGLKIAWLLWIDQHNFEIRPKFAYVLSRRSAWKSLFAFNNKSDLHLRMFYQDGRLANRWLLSLLRPYFTYVLIKMICLKIADCFRRTNITLKSDLHLIVLWGLSAWRSLVAFKMDNIIWKSDLNLLMFYQDGRLENRWLFSAHQHNFEIRPKFAYALSRWSAWKHLVVCCWPT